MNLVEAFGVSKPVIGMLHVPPLPGSPAHQLCLPEIREWVARDTEALVAGGVDALMLENFGDAPFYPGRVPRHTVAFLTMLALEVKARSRLPLGINVLRNDGISAIAVAAATGAEYVRVNVYTGARLADQGILQGEAHRILRYRQTLGASVRIFADVAVKHSAAIGARPLEDEVEDTVTRGRADAVIVSGAGTGKATPVIDLQRAKAAAGGAPVFVGSGSTASNLGPLLAAADGLIAGTALKKDGVATNPVDIARVWEFMNAVRSLR